MHTGICRLEPAVYRSLPVQADSTSAVASAILPELRLGMSSRHRPNLHRQLAMRGLNPVRATTGGVATVGPAGSGAALATTTSVVSTRATSLRSPVIPVTDMVHTWDRTRTRTRTRMVLLRCRRVATSVAIRRCIVPIEIVIRIRSTRDTAGWATRDTATPVATATVHRCRTTRTCRATSDRTTRRRRRDLKQRRVAPRERCGARPATRGSAARDRVSERVLATGARARCSACSRNDFRATIGRWPLDTAGTCKLSTPLVG